MKALKDVQFGNTKIEARDKFLKQDCLHRKSIDEEEMLKAELEQFVFEFNAVRPHHDSEGMTPLEMHESCENYFNDSYWKITCEARKSRCR